MSYNTYSFQDVTASFSCLGYGAGSSTGAGLGSIAVAMAQTKTVHEAAADGEIMISKVLGENGTITITMQQTSQLHKYLLNWYNFINNSSKTSYWAAMVIRISSTNLDDLTVATGVSPQKLADKPYQSQGQMITWTLMAAKIVQS